MKNEKQNEEQRINSKNRKLTRDEIEQYLQKEEEDKNKNNYIANAIKILACTTLCGGFILGIILALEFESFMTLIFVWEICSIEALFLLAFAEIIQILHDIRLKMYKK